MSFNVGEVVIWTENDLRLYKIIADKTTPRDRSYKNLPPLYPDAGKDYLITELREIEGRDETVAFVSVLASELQKLHD